MYAKIYWVENFRGRQGYRCDLKGREEDDLGMSWFFPSIEGKISDEIISEIKKLLVLGYKVDII